MSEQAQHHEPVRFGYLGPAGTFAEAALRTVSEPEDELVPYATVPEALDAVRGGEVVGAVVPLENSGDGAADALDELAQGEPLHVVGEVLLPVIFVLLGRPGTTLEDVLVVATHSPATATTPPWQRRSPLSTTACRCSLTVCRTAKASPASSW